MHNKKQRTLMIALTVLCLIGLPASYAFSRHSAYKIKQARIASEEKIRLQQEENDRIEAQKRAEQEIEENKKIKLVAKTNYESHKEEVKIKEKKQEKIKEEKKKERVKKLKKEKINQDKEAKKLSTNTYSETTGTYVDLDKEFKEAGKKGKEIKKFSKKDEKKKQVQKLGNVKVKEISPEVKKPNKHKNDDDLSWVAGHVTTDEERAKDFGMTTEEYLETRRKADAGDKKARYILFGSVEENTIVTDPNDHEKVPYEIE